MRVRAKRAPPFEVRSLKFESCLPSGGIMTRLSIWASAAVVGGLALSGPVIVAQQSDGFRPLFNGRDLTGWVNVNCAPTTWTVADNMIHSSGKPICELRTTRMYENFTLELEFMHLTPKGNAGVFVWGDAITARGQPFVRAIEIQVFQGNHGDMFPIHGARMTPTPESPNRGDRSLPREARSKPVNEWNHYRITANKGILKLAVNGAEVAGGFDISPRKGYIHLESEGGVVKWRNLRIRELPSADKLTPDQIANADEGHVSLYNGVDFTGWQFPAGHKDHWVSRDWWLSYDGLSTAPDKNLTSVRTFGDVSVVADWRQTASPDPVLPIGFEGMTLPADAQALATKAIAAAGQPPPPRQGGPGAGARTAGAGGQTAGPQTTGGTPADGRGGQAATAGGATPATATGEQAGRRGGGGGGGGGGAGRPWVRGVLTRRGGRVSLTINGQPVFENVAAPGASSRGRLVLRHQERPIDYASIFVKTLN
jgi:hypothetical protein